MKKSRGIVIDRGYVKIRIWPKGRQAPAYIEHFGPVNKDNLDRAEFKLRSTETRLRWVSSKLVSRSSDWFFLKRRIFI